MSWNEDRLGNIVEKVVGGGTPSRDVKKYWNGDIPWMTVKDLKGRSPQSTEERITKEAVEESATNIIPPNTVIVATRIALGKAVKVPYPTAINQDLKAIYLPKSVNPDFFLYWWEFKAPEIANMGSGTTVKGIRLEVLNDLLFRFPELSLQNRIVRKIGTLFSEIDAGLEDLRKAKANLDLYKQSVLNSAIQGKLLPQNPKDEPASKLLERIRAEKEKLIEAGKLKKEKPLAPISEEETFGSIPKTWEFVRLGTIADHCLGKMLDKAKNRGTSQPYLRNINVRWFEFDLNDLLQMKFESNERERFQILKNDLVICEGGEPGRCAVWKRDEPIYFQKALHRVRPFSGIKSDYLALCIYADARFGRLESYFTGTGIKHFVGERLHTYVLPLPPIEEQDRISKAVNRIFSEISSHESDIAQQIQKLSLLKQSILKTAFEGRLI